MSMTHDEMIEVIKAHKEGKAIENSPLYGPEHGGWDEVLFPIFNFRDWKYRVKPEPVTAYARLSSAGAVTDLATSKAVSQFAVYAHGGRLVKLVEVPEE